MGPQNCRTFEALAARSLQSGAESAVSVVDNMSRPAKTGVCVTVPPIWPNRCHQKQVLIASRDALWSVIHQNKNAEGGLVCHLPSLSSSAAGTKRARIFLSLLLPSTSAQGAPWSPFVVHYRAPRRFCSKFPVPLWLQPTTFQRLHAPCVRAPFAFTTLRGTIWWV